MSTFAPSLALETGVELAYVEQGDRSGVPVVLLHGITDSHRSMEPLLAHLPDSVRAFALTHRGHGDSSRPEDGYRPVDLAEDVRAFLDAVGIERAVVVGHSMSGHAARRFAIDHPDRTRGLVLIGSMGTARANPAVRGFWDADVAGLKDPIDPEFVRAFQLSTLARPVPPAFLELVVSESLKVPARVWRAALRGMLDDDDSDDLRRIAAPTTLMWGDLDAFASRAEQEVLLAAIPAARLVVFEGVGHTPHWEEPARIAELLTAIAVSPGSRAPVLYGV